MEKQCRKCGQVKPLDAFYHKSKARAHIGDGYSATCKECMKQHQRSPEARILASKAWARRYATEEGKAKIKEKSKRARQKDAYKKAHKIRNTRYLHTEKGRQKSRELQRKYHKTQWYREAVDRYRVNNPEKRQAQIKIMNAVAHGKLIRPDRCSVCGEACVPDGHHEDYSKPLEVVWMCHQCHIDYHKSLLLPASHGSLWRLSY